MRPNQINIIDLIADERDGLRDENKRLKHEMEIMMSAVSHLDRIAKERDAANGHIKRLDKAGDNMYCLLGNSPEAYNWHKARTEWMIRNQAT